MTEETTGYDTENEGFGSRYSFIPESIAGLNNKLYTFKEGNLYVHNEESNRNEFYGIHYPSILKTVFNQDPTNRKLVKAISIEGTHPWDVIAETDIQTSGFIEALWFEHKEGSWYAFVRNSGGIPVTQEELASRHLRGLGQSTIVDVTVPALTVLSFPLTLNLKEGMSVGDIMYHALPPYSTPLLSGKIISVNVDIPNSVNNIVIDSTFDVGTVPILINDPFFLAIKNPIAESSGVLGHYCEVTLENNDTEVVEIFTVEAEVMKSFH